MNDEKCTVCKGVIPPSPWDFTPGYGVDKDGNKVCYVCCGVQDRADMIATGRATLYLTMAVGTVNNVTRLRGKVSNWPGSLEWTDLHIRKGRHNWAGRRYDTWFNGPDGYVWHGTQYGDDTQIIHCKRTSRKVGG